MTWQSTSPANVLGSAPKACEMLVPAPEFRASYNDGWVPVLDRFGQAANA